MQSIKCKCRRVLVITKDCVRCGCGETMYATDTLPQFIPGNPCDHRGESTRKVHCKNCKGGVKVKVFECGIHGECTIKKRVPDAHVCFGCDDWKAVVGAVLGFVVGLNS